MSRKSKLTIYREKLAMISNSPTDIFNMLEPSDAILNSIIAAENGDKGALCALSDLLFSVYSKEREPNDSAVYFMNKGVLSGDVRSAVNLVIYCSIKNDAIEHVDKALELIEKANADISPDVVKDVLLKRVIYDAETDISHTELIKRLQAIQHRAEPFALVYLTCKAIQKNMATEEELEHLCREASLPPLNKMSLSEKPEQEYAVISAEKRAFMNAFKSCNLDIWQDFWLRCIYEYCIKYLNDNLVDFAEDIARALERRRFSHKAKLHALAFIKHTYESCPEGSEKRADLLRWYEKTVKECMLDGSFENIDSKDDTFRLMREAAYTSEYNERRDAEAGIDTGHRIVHERNRYKLECALTGHAKRGNRHMWEAKLSIETKSDEPPVFQNIVINDRRNVIGRGNTTLEQEKKRSQVICSGEIQIGNKTSPFVLDLILDIAYISTTKCDQVQIKPKRIQIVDNSVVMDCQIYIS